MTFFKKSNFSNILFGLFIVLMIVPSSRRFIQLGVQKGLSKIIPASINSSSAKKMESSFILSLKGVNGADLLLSGEKKKVIIINYWATWCPPCVAEMPAFQKLYDIYKEDIVFAFISNENSNTIISFLNANKYTLPVYAPLKSLPKELSYSSFPTTYIIDKQGNIVLHKTGVANWGSDSFFKQLDSLLE